MTFVLYPQLPVGIANSIARERGGMDPAALKALAGTHHERATYSATGGTRVTERRLMELAERVRALQMECPSRLHLDSHLARLLHTEMRLSRGEAALEGVWAFLGCAVLPDIVRWRFEAPEATPPERFVGGSRGIRNALGRCWWRGELLYDESRQADDPYWLLDKLVEDEMTGIIERQRAVASRRVAVALARSLVEVDTQGLLRMNVARDAFKRYLRLSAFVCFEALEPEELRIACESIYLRSVRALAAGGGESQ